MSTSPNMQELTDQLSELSSVVVKVEEEKKQLHEELEKKSREKEESDKRCSDLEAMIEESYLKNQKLNLLLVVTTKNKNTYRDEVERLTHELQNKKLIIDQLNQRLDAICEIAQNSSKSNQVNDTEFPPVKSPKTFRDV